MSCDRRFDYEELDIPAVAVDEQTQKQKQKQRRGGGGGGGSSSSRDVADGEEFEFRLFASQALRAGDAVARVNIRSPTPLAERGKGGFVVPCRPGSYYFASFGDADADAEGWRRRRDEYRDLAVDGQDVMTMARSTAWVRESSVLHMC